MESEVATYGLQTTPGFVSFTGWTSVLGGSGSANGTGATSGTVGANGVTQADALLSRIFRNGEQTLVFTKLLSTLVGVAPGALANKTMPRVKGTPQLPAGGVIPIETVTLVNRNTTAADVTAMQALLGRVVFPPTYAADLSGNGGGGKGAW
jgi:hypothetical protein